MGAVTDKQGMVIMDKIDVSNFLVLGMEKMEDDKMMNPHGLFTLRCLYASLST